ncbi:MAG: nicotinate phosphoribosyltransferase [Alphaproteobacteria bacterium 13_2_20CM_2_64_7]|nr:MAG: nicotinate phosphoribosyltransferase [Alphaproteobacteria bacterium 13_2_20CM_2_64_7]
MDPATSALLTDLYQLNMMQAYLDRGETKTAVFEFFVRKLPRERGFLIAAGLEQVLEFLSELRFTPEELEWLASSGRFGKNLIDYLAGLRFTGAIHAMPEGTAFFPDEPILRVTAALPEAQLVETRLINLLQFQSMIAAKAARMVLAAPGKRLVDFGLRRAHGAEAGFLAARASYIAGFAGTATVLADKEFGIPIFGTMAHSYIQVHDDEAEAFENFARARPKNLTLLIDTYNTEAAARKVVALAPRLKAAGISIGGVRLDSGDLITLSKAVRRILDEGGLRDVTIFASGGLDETVIAKIIRSGAPIDGFGIGSSLTTSYDAPGLDCAYKLEEYAGLPRRKRSAGKATWPGRKQVWRRFGADGRMAGDILSLENDDQAGEPLIELIMQGGKRVAPAPLLAEIRARAARDLQRLPEPLRRLEPGASYPVEVSEALRRLAAEVDGRVAQQNAKG